LGRLDELDAHSNESGDALIDKMCDQRLAFMRSLRNYPSFKKGWERRVAEVRKAAKQMNNHLMMSTPTKLLAEECGKALSSETKITATPEGNTVVKQGSSWSFTTIMGYVAAASEHISLLTGLPPKVVQVVGLVGFSLGVVAIVSFTTYSIMKLYWRRRKGEDMESN